MTLTRFWSVAMTSTYTFQCPCRTSVTCPSLTSPHSLVLSALPVGNSLEIANVASNYIVDVTYPALSGLDATPLTGLYLTETGNMLVRLAPALTNLKNLHCYHSTGIHTMTIPYFPKLWYVSIRYSTMTSLPDMLALTSTLTSFSLRDSPNFNPDPDHFKIFAAFPQITVLRLDGNNLTTLPDMFQLLPALTSIKLARNPWHCDEKLAWMVNPAYTTVGFIKDFSSVDFECASPPYLAGMRLSQLPAGTLLATAAGWF